MSGSGEERHKNSMKSDGSRRHFGGPAGKESKMRKKKSLIILAVALVVLLGVYLGLQAWNRHKEDRQAAEEEAARIHVADTDPEDIVSMKFNVGSGDMSFEKEDGTWYYTPDRDFPLLQDYPDDMAKTLGELTADRELEDGDSLADYGLDDPDYTVEFEDGNGVSTTLYFGNVTGDYYYMTVGDTGEVYTVSTTVIDDLNHSLDDMAQLDDYPSIGSGNLVRETITRNGETVTYDSENDEQAEDVAAVAGGLGAVSLTNVADYSADDGDLPQYGLDEDTKITVEAVYTTDGEEQTLTLYIGNENGEGDRYVMLNDSRIVYLISDEICDNILNVPDGDE